MGGGATPTPGEEQALGNLHDPMPSELDKGKGNGSASSIHRDRASSRLAGKSKSVRRHRSGDYSEVT